MIGAVIIFFAWYAICAVLSHSSYVAFWGWPNDHAYGILAVLGYALLFAMAKRQGCRSPDLLVTVIALAGCLCAGVGISQKLVFECSGEWAKYVPGGRPVGTMGGPPYFGVMLAMMLPFARRRPWATGFILIGLFLSQSMAAWLAAGGAVAFTLRSEIWRNKRIAAAITLLAVLVAGMVYSKRPGVAQSFAGHMEAWSQAVRISKDHLLAGVGPSQFQTRSRAMGYPAYHRHAHNDLLEALVTTGIPGMLMYALLWAVMLRAVMRLKFGCDLEMGAAVIAYFVAAKFQPMALESSAMCAVLCGIIASNGWLRDE